MPYSPLRSIKSDPDYVEREGSNKAFLYSREVWEVSCVLSEVTKSIILNHVSISKGRDLEEPCALIVPVFGTSVRASLPSIKHFRETVLI